MLAHMAGLDPERCLGVAQSSHWVRRKRVEAHSVARWRGSGVPGSGAAGEQRQEIVRRRDGLGSEEQLHAG